MIESYKIENDIVTALDNLEGYVDYEYQDNVDEIFLQKNVIEKINTDIHNKKDDKKTKVFEFNLRFEKKNVIKYCILVTLLFVGMWAVILPKMPLLALAIALTSSVVSNGMIHLLNIPDKIKLQNQINADTLEIEELESLLEQEQTKLQELYNNKSKDKIIDNSDSFVEKNISRLDKINNLKELYRLCGYYAKKLIKYQEKGILRDKLDKSFTNEDLIIIENLIEEKCPQFVKSNKK